jgi:hypothetical protein
VLASLAARLLAIRTTGTPLRFRSLVANHGGAAFVTLGLVLRSCPSFGGLSPQRYKCLESTT